MTRLGTVWHRSSPLWAAPKAGMPCSPVSNYQHIGRNQRQRTLVRVCCPAQQLSSAKKGWHFFFAETYHVNETWVEPAFANDITAENANATEPARVFVVVVTGKDKLQRSENAD